jgi:hypothetical protein
MDDTEYLSGLDQYMNEELVVLCLEYIKTHPGIKTKLYLDIASVQKEIVRSDSLKYYNDSVLSDPQLMTAIMQLNNVGTLSTEMPKHMVLTKHASDTLEDLHLHLWLKVYGNLVTPG